MSDKVIKCLRGEMFYADLSPVVGSEQGGVRLVVVVSNNKGNKSGKTVVILAMTTSEKDSKLPVHVKLSELETLLDTKSVVLAEQIRTLDKKRLKEKVGSLSKEVMEKISEALRIELDL